jgi:sugar-specific transcriptional regulator TrmB
MKNKVESLLLELDFSEKEVEIFIVLLEHGSAKASDISKITGLNRTTVYDILESLMRMGLISKYRKRSVMHFSVHDPKQLIGYLENEKNEKAKQIEKQKKQVEALMPEIVGLMNFSKKERPQVRFFEGEKGMREAYGDTLNSKGEILAYANVETMHKALPDFFPEYYNRRAEKKILIKAILPKNKLSEQRALEDNQEMRETRFLPDGKMTFSPEINLYNNKMLVVSWKEKMAIIIESKALVDLMKLTHGLLWENLSTNSESPRNHE